MLNSLKNELQDILSGKNEAKYGSPIQTILSYLTGSEKTGETNQQDQYFKKEETKRLIKWIEENQFWYADIDIEPFVSERAEQKVFLKNEFEVLKLNDSIYYNSWRDYLQNLLLNNYFFPDTAYQLLGLSRKRRSIICRGQTEICEILRTDQFGRSKEIHGAEWFFKYPEQ